MKKIGKKEKPVVNPKRIVKPIEAPDVFTKPQEVPVEIPTFVPVEVPCPSPASPGSVH